MSSPRHHGKKAPRALYQERFSGLSPELIKALEGAISHPLSPEVVNALELPCLVFADCGPGPKQLALAKEMMSKIDVWRRRTVALRNQIWRQPEAALSHQGTISYEYLMSMYFRAKERIIISQNDLNTLANALDTAIDTSLYVSQRLQSGREHGDYVNHLWAAWAATVEAIMRDHGYPTTASSGDKSAKDSPFVSFVLTLQASLPSDCRQRTTAHSVAKGIQQAKTRFQGIGALARFILLLSWAAGGYPIYTTDGAFTSQQEIDPEVRNALVEVEDFLKRESHALPD